MFGESKKYKTYTLFLNCLLFNLFSLFLILETCLQLAFIIEVQSNWSLFSCYAILAGAFAILCVNISTLMIQPTFFKADSD